MNAKAFLAALVLTTSSSAFALSAPEIIFAGTAPGEEPGARVARTSGSSEKMLALLDPAADLDLATKWRDRALVLIVGEERENACRETVLREVSTKFITAIAKVEERVPAAGCRCAATTRPPAAWVVAVNRMVLRARTEIDRVEVSCEEARLVAESAPADMPVLLMGGSWDASPGADLIKDQASLDTMFQKMGTRTSGPDVDFTQNSVVVATGRPRSNGCRKTDVIKAGVEGEGEFVVRLRETYGTPDQICTQVYLQPKVFVYRVPASVTSARVVTEEVGK